MEVCGDGAALSGNGTVGYYGVLVMAYPELTALNLDKQIIEVINADEIKLYKVNAEYQK